MKTKITLKDLSTSEESRKTLFEYVAKWLMGERVSEIELVGTLNQVNVLKRAVLESKNFHNCLLEKDSSLKSITASFKSRLEAAKKFEDTFQTQWLL